MSRDGLFFMMDSAYSERRKLLEPTPARATSREFWLTIAFEVAGAFAIVAIYWKPLADALASWWGR